MLLSVKLLSLQNDTHCPVAVLPGTVMYFVAISHFSAISAPPVCISCFSTADILRVFAIFAAACDIHCARHNTAYKPFSCDGFTFFVTILYMAYHSQPSARRTLRLRDGLYNVVTHANTSNVRIKMCFTIITPYCGIIAAVFYLNYCIKTQKKAYFFIKNMHKCLFFPVFCTYITRPAYLYSLRRQQNIAAGLVLLLRLYGD